MGSSRGLKVGALAVGCYLGSLLASFVLTVVCAASTEHWGAARAENLVLLLFAAIVGLFFLGAATVGLGAWRLLSSWKAGLAVLAGYLVVVGPTLLLTGFFLAVIFNR